MTVKDFGTTSADAPVREVTIGTGDLTLKLIEWGCVLRDLRFNPLDRPLTLGLETIEDYETRSPHFGAIAGRFANRIRGGRFSIDGESFQATRNQDGETTLHGGAFGFGKSLWRLEDHGPDHAIFAITHADGQEGFPGEISATCAYRMDGGAISVELTATADRPTLCNLAQHSYFNLSDEPTVNDHVLEMAADRWTPLGDDLVPTGEVRAVADDLDFRAGRSLRDQPIDLNFCLADQRRATPAFAARLTGGALALTLETTEPGLQLYTGDKVNLPAIGLGGRCYGGRAGVCMEAQVWPDAPNHPAFPSGVLRPGETYRQETVLRIDKA